MAGVDTTCLQSANLFFLIEHQHDLARLGAVTEIRRRLVRCFAREGICSTSPSISQILMAYMIPPKQIYAKPNFQSALQHLAPHHIMHPFATTVTKKRGGSAFVVAQLTRQVSRFNPTWYILCADNSHSFPNSILHWNYFDRSPPYLGVNLPLFTWTGTAEWLVCRNRRNEREIGTTPRRKKSARVQEAKSTDSPAAADDVGPGGQRPAGLPGDGGGGGLPRRHAGGG